MEKEYRSLDIDIKEDGEKLILEGRPIVFESETLIGGEERGFYEVIDKNAIDMSTLKDCCLKYNHNNSTLILARVRNKSLQLSIDEKGVLMRAELQPNVQQHRDIYNLVKSGLLDSMSFAFIVKEQQVERSGRLLKRRITKIGRIFEISIVDTPAYSDTEIHARSLEMVEQEIATIESEERNSEKAKADLEKLKIKIKLNLH